MDTEVMDREKRIPPSAANNFDVRIMLLSLR
jgi:hypothetical protein